MSACRFCGADPEAVVIGTWEIFVPVPVKSQNVMASNSGAGRFAYGQARDTFELVIRNEARRVRVPPVKILKRRRRVVFTRVYSGRARPFDLANLIGGMKPFVDAMVNAGMLVDDSEIWFEGHYRQRRVEDGRGVLVFIEELG